MAETARSARTRLYRDGKLVLEGFPLPEISDHLAEAGTVVWLDLCAPTPSDFETITEEFGLHELAVEDARHEHQRPKLDRYADHCFLSMYAVCADRGGEELSISELSVFVTANALITVRPDDRFDMDDVVVRWDNAPALAEHGVGFLLHGLLDQVVDGHFRAVQEMDDRIEEIEEGLFDGTAGDDREIQRAAFALRKNLVRLRRIVLPMREMVNTLMRRDLHFVNESMVPYYQDVYDHVLRVTEWTESLRDMVGSIMETNLTIQGNRMNMIMKKVTSWASIVAVPTAVTGFYGQNVPYPGFNTAWGFWCSTGVTVLLSVALYFGFKRRDWI
ncbi:magnesium transporter CorA family protein [Streptacidiphilus neutrinimicus]|uniref:magnesium transporter CorA family protein n=1 Tax=Streptacidiphilus neutrinimicus TaxID=105420 RepID=UPI0005A7318E|nr:magnesium transporter CorA family protein [Streptacidiphilus neutrinimicus]